MEKFTGRCNRSYWVTRNNNHSVSFHRVRRSHRVGLRYRRKSAEIDIAPLIRRSGYSFGRRANPDLADVDHVGDGRCMLDPSRLPATEGPIDIGLIFTTLPIQAENRANQISVIPA